MPQHRQHRIHRHPAAPWAELRVSTQTFDCYRAHSHAEYSVGIVDQGCATFHHADGSHPVMAGSVVLIEPGIVHACNPVVRQAWSYRMLFIDAAWLHHAVAQVWGRALPCEGLAFSSRHANDAAVTQSVDGFCQPVTSDCAASALAAQLPQWIARHARPEGAQYPATVPVDLVAAIDTMHTEIERRITVKELAKACAMSDSQFIRRFHAAFGMTPGGYLQNLRLNGARRLLSQGMALADAAHSMGFADQAHMQRAFKVHHAMTPGTYRRRR